jgi:hypothetical protein
MVLEETAHVVAQYWSATGRPASGAPTAPADGGRAPAASRNGNGGRHLRRPPAGRHERRR